MRIVITGHAMIISISMREIFGKTMGVPYHALISTAHVWIYRGEGLAGFHADVFVAMGDVIARVVRAVVVVVTVIIFATVMRMLAMMERADVGVVGVGVVLARCHGCITLMCPVNEEAIY